MIKVLTSIVPDHGGGCRKNEPTPMMNLFTERYVTKPSKINYNTILSAYTYCNLHPEFWSYQSLTYDSFFGIV